MSIGTNMNKFRQQLEKELAGKRFLLVLDDVWDDVSVWWYSFKIWLFEICASSGNAIIVTTRSKQVASIVEASTQHWYTLRLLSDNDCWSILKSRTIRTDQVSEEVEREIAKKCRGLPLVAVVLGGILRYKYDERYWLKIRDSNNSSVPSFKLSFDQLPSYLKPCFLFCSIFPKDFPIVKEELIRLWMAEGFVESYNEGNKYFDVLLATSLFQVAESDDDRDVIQCKMYDCVHDLALFLSKYDELTTENSSIDYTSRIRYLFANAQFPTTTMNDRAKKLRTVILDGAPYQESWKLKSLRALYINGADVEVLPSMDKVKHLRYLHISNSKIKKLPKSLIKSYNLQTLNLSNSEMNELPEFITLLPNLQTLIVSNSNIKAWPESIGKLYNLQMLDVSNSNIVELPESILKLKNLQTLKFLECKELTKLPREKIHDLISLKHIAFSYEHQMPLGLGRLNGLETLTCFFVGSNWGCSIEQLGCLNELSGHLEITRLEEVRDKKEAERANIHCKSELQGLTFQWSYGANNRSSRDEELLEGLQPHQNIRRLTGRLAKLKIELRLVRLKIEMEKIELR